ncbi:hypothetical protein [Streptomyces clavifer]|uniref:hypothetical protein n=1 Tax=Streptomyces clavifer TaxID=68188 RepID=UPI0033A51320
MLDRWISDSVEAFRMKRAVTLTTGAAPGPVRKAGTLTVRGKHCGPTHLSHHGFTKQVARLRYEEPYDSHSRVKTATARSTSGRP